MTKTLKQFNSNDRFLSILVYQFPLGNCAGITDDLKNIYIPCENGNTMFDSINENHIFIEEQRGPNYYALNPNIQPTGVIGPMSGGNIAYSSDSRCKKVYHIHDRFETQEVYNALSR
jgi:hypothetical protein